MPNLATLMVGLGYDLSSLEKGAPEAFRLINSQTLGMSAEMKRSSREGAESFRLLDEAMGLHVSRPLTRILTQEFPAFAQGLQAILGGAVFGAVAAVGVEAFDKVARKVEEARKAQDAFAESSRKAAETIETVLGGLQNKLAEASGNASMKFGLLGAAEAKRAVEEIGRALDRAAADSEKAAGFWTKVYLKAGDWAETIGRGAAKMADAIAGLYNSGPLGNSNAGIHDKYFDPQQVASMKDALKDMRVDLEIALNTDAAKGTHQSLALLGNDIKAATAYLKDMEKAGDESGAALARASLEFFSSSQRAAQLSLRIAGAEAAEDAVRKFKEWQKSFDENPFWQDWSRTNDELEKALAKMREMGALTESAQREQRAKALDFPEIGAVAPPRGAPQLSDQAELQKITDDQNASWAKAGQILNQIESPIQKYQGQLAILRELEDQGRISTEQFALAQQKLQEQLVQSQNRLQQMEKELQKLLEHSDSARDGVRAFFLQLNIDSQQTGKFVFDTLSQGLKGFNDQLTNLVFEGKAKWEDLFRSLAESAFKHMLEVTESNLFKLLLGPLGGGAGGGGFGIGSIAGFAGGTDSAPGGLAWVGEQGPELLNLPSGSSVTPAAALRGGGDTHYYDMRGAVVTDDLMRKADAAAMMRAARPSIIGEAVANFSEIQRRTPK